MIAKWLLNRLTYKGKPILKDEHGETNPWIVLGVIFLGLIITVGGAIAVPGWIKTGQDSNARGDVARIDIVQQGLVAVEGSYSDDLDHLANNSAGVGFIHSQGVEYAIEVSNGAYLIVSKSESGHFFAKISGSSKIGEGETISAAMSDAGATETWATANSITLPTTTTAPGA